MKNIIIAVIAMFAFNVSFAQSTSPRFGTTAGRDNTYRVLTLGYTSVTETAGNDTLEFRPTKYTNYYRLTMTDSTTFSISSTANSYAGDVIKIIASGTSGDLLKFIGSNLLTAGTATFTTNERAVIELVFDGAKWVEASRAVH